LIGGGVVVFILIGVIAFLLLPSEPAVNTEATQTAEAIITITGEAQQAAAAATAAQETAVAATVAFLAPTQAAQTATAEAERIAAADAALATRSFEAASGVFATAQAATAEAATAQAGEAETVTAIAIASIPPTPTPEPATATATPAPATATPTPAPIVVAAPTDTPTPADTPTPERPALSGRLAFPVDNGAARYDVHIVSMPSGKLLAKIEGARQPNFRRDGLKLLINGQGSSFGENVFEMNGNSGAVEKPVSGSPSDLFPVYKPDGTTLAYSNPQLAFGAVGYQSYLFVQCGLKPPSEESDKCAAIADFGIIIPPNAIGDIIGSHPVWTDSDLLAYRGCNTWAGGGSCGIFVVGSWAVKRTSSGELPRKILDGGSLHPTDAKAGLVAYQSHESGNWEAFIAADTGAGAVNISNNPGSEDGLPTISPDGKWVAFASNREGGWAIYVAPSSGGQVQKLFDFPSGNPWGTGDREWINERMSWAP
jgi:hypothetical protein